MQAVRAIKQSIFLRCLWDSGSSTVVEHLPRYPKVQGLSPVAAVGTGRENSEKKKERKKDNSIKVGL
jgi:hypothetical protein